MVDDAYQIVEQPKKNTLAEIAELGPFDNVIVLIPTLDVLLTTTHINTHKRSSFI